MRLQSLTLDELILRGVSPAFAGILANPESYHRDLSIQVGRTNWDYFIPNGVVDVVPLWDCNEDSFVRWNREGIIEYVLLFHDDPDWVLVAHSEQGIMSQLWQKWAEFKETDEECRRFADAIGFRYCEEGLEVLENHYETIEEWRFSLVG